MASVASRVIAAFLTGIVPEKQAASEYNVPTLGRIDGLSDAPEAAGFEPVIGV